MLSWLQDWWSTNTAEHSQHNHHGYIEPYLKTDESEPSLCAEEKSTLQNMAFRLSRLILDGATTYEICDIIKSCPHKHQLLSERDFYGYNALQYAVICARDDLVVEMIRFGADVNLPTCGRPLHLACKLGHAQMVKTLLSHGADQQVLACVCYPFHHTKEGFTYSNIQKKWSLSCCGDVYTNNHDPEITFDFPLYYAFLSNSVECMISLESAYSDSQKMFPLRHPHPIHLLCEVGAQNILQYLLEKPASNITPEIHKTTPQSGRLNPSPVAVASSPSVPQSFKNENPSSRPDKTQREGGAPKPFRLDLDVNEFDDKGLIPLHYAIKWGAGLIEYLVLRGANVQLKTREDQTMLHVLYCGATERWLSAHHKDVKTHNKPSSSAASSLSKNKNLELPVSMDESTRYLLKCGLQMNINARDVHGNTALHYLLPLLHVNMNYRSGHLNKDRSQAWVDTVSKCVQALLQAHINPNIPNKCGNTSLHALFNRPNLKISGKDQAECEIPTDKFIYNLQGIHTVLEDLLSCGAKLNMVNNEDLTAVDILIKIGMKSIFGQLPRKWRAPDKRDVCSFIACLKILCREGFHFDDHIHGQKFLQHVLIHITEIDKLVYYQQPGSPFGSADHRVKVTEYVSSILDVVETLLQCGCNPNAAKTTQNRTSVAGSQPDVVDLRSNPAVCFSVNSLHLAYYLLMNRQAVVPVEQIHRCMLLFLHYGVDPNRDGEHVPLSVLQPYGNEVRSVFPLLHILNVIGCSHKSHSAATRRMFHRLFEVLYNSMDDSMARQCLQYYVTYDKLHMSRLWLPHAQTLVFGIYNVNFDGVGVDGAAGQPQGDLFGAAGVDDIPSAALKSKSRSVADEPDAYDFNKILDTLLHNPRSLKQLSRTAVVKVMNHQIGCIKSMPLPTTLKTYFLTQSM